MSGPNVEQTAEPEEAAEDGRWEDIRKWAECFRGTPAEESWIFIFAEFDRLRAEVAAAEERGARAERERIAAAIEKDQREELAVAPSQDNPYVKGSMLGYRRSLQMVRGTL